MTLIEKLDYALTMLIGIENVDEIYEAKTEKDIETFLLNLDKE